MSKVTLRIIVEGDTEEGFVKRVLAEYLRGFGVETQAIKAWTSRDKTSKTVTTGGLNDYKMVKKQIKISLSKEKEYTSRFTTMFDLYQLPKNFPSYQDARSEKNCYFKVEKLEAALSKDIDDYRFIPYIQLHEFKTLIFVDLDELRSEFLQNDNAIRKLKAVLKQKGGDPELINDGTKTAPSKRIIKEIPDYKFNKATVGPMIVERIGVELLRQNCKHFNEWLTKLESLPQDLTNKAK